jgi:hypothetical protein
MSSKERAGREAKLERLVLAMGDMADAQGAAEALLRLNLPFHVRRALRTGMFASYARAFNDSRGDPPLPAAPTRGLTQAQRELHDWALAERDSVWAHSDRRGHRRGQATEDVKGNLAFEEQWTSLTNEQLTALSELAQALRERYKREAETLSRELQ